MKLPKQDPRLVEAFIGRELSEADKRELADTDAFIEQVCERNGTWDIACEWMAGAIASRDHIEDIWFVTRHSDGQIFCMDIARQVIHRASENYRWECQRDEDKRLKRLRRKFMPHGITIKKGDAGFEVLLKNKRLAREMPDGSIKEQHSLRALEALSPLEVLVDVREQLARIKWAPGSETVQ